MKSLNWTKIQYNFNNILLILYMKYFYNRLRFKVVIDKSCRGHFFPDTVYISLTVERERKWQVSRVRSFLFICMSSSVDYYKRTKGSGQRDLRTFQFKSERHTALCDFQCWTKLEDHSFSCCSSCRLRCWLLVVANSRWWSARVRRVQSRRWTVL